MKHSARAAALIAVLLLTGCAAGGPGLPVRVDFVNDSRMTKCAEEDNVYVKVLGPGIGAFRIRGEHPPYIFEVKEDSLAPDFTDCDMSNDPSFPSVPRTVTLYEDASIRLVGHTFPSFWRPDIVDFRVGTRVESGLHLVQLVHKDVPFAFDPAHAGAAGPASVALRDVEILVVYPADGYWRAKPLPPVTLLDTGYGSSFLFGPIEEDGRPHVALREIRFDPASMTFRLTFRDGSRGSLAVTRATRTDVELALTLDAPLPAGRPFAALRSMYVRTAQSDVALVAWPGERSGEFLAAPVLGFSRIQSTVARFGRDTPSLHNLSAPDFVFDRFAPMRNTGTPAETYGQ